MVRRGREEEMKGEFKEVSKDGTRRRIGRRVISSGYH
jgi:hypothetical protein